MRRNSNFKKFEEFNVWTKIISPSLFACWRKNPPQKSQNADSNPFLDHYVTKPFSNNFKYILKIGKGRKKGYLPTVPYLPVPTTLVRYVSITYKQGCGSGSESDPDLFGTLVGSGARSEKFSPDPDLYPDPDPTGTLAM